MINATDILHGKILIVDDQVANVLLLEQMLQGAGYDSVTSTTDPTTVCELHLLNAYDLILLDLQMPGMDGFQVMENLKEIETGGYLPVLVITAQPEHKLRALRSGARDFISKPFDLAEVLIRVHNMLEVRLLNKEAKALYEHVVSQQKLAERLLQNVLPHSIAERLQARSVIPIAKSEGLVAESFAEVTAVFADLLAFTKFSEGASAEVLMGVLGDIAARFDTQDGRPGLKRINTIGDAYLASVGLSDEVTAHSIRSSHMALDLFEAVDRFNEHSRYKLKVRIGMDSGGTMTGAIKRESTFDL